MTKREKSLQRLMSGQADTDIAFDDLCSLLRRLGFQSRIRRGHHIFTKDGVEEILNLQPIGAKAKPYQVKQVRAIIRNYGLNEDKK